MKMLFLFLAISSLMLGFTGCLKDKEPVYYYVDEPAIVSNINQIPALNTAWGVFSAPNLSDTLKAGDCLWTNFIVDWNNQKSNTAQLSGLQYRKLGLDSVRKTSGMQDSYNDPINRASMYKASVDSILFFVFTHGNTAQTDNDDMHSTETSDAMRHSGNEYKYEIFYNTDSTILVNGREIPKLYIKSKRLKQSESTPSKFRFAFNMREFASKYADPSSRTVPLYLHYKTGVSPEGKDIYKTFRTYPVKWSPK